MEPQQNERKRRRVTFHPGTKDPIPMKDRVGKEDNVLQAGGHPYGVEPSGNRWLKRGQAGGDGGECRSSGLGGLRILDDEILLTVLGLLSPQELGMVVQVSRAFYVIGHCDELWRALMLKQVGRSAGGFWFKHTWKDTLVATLLGYNAESGNSSSSSSSSSNGGSAAEGARLRGLGGGAGAGGVATGGGGGGAYWEYAKQTTEENPLYLFDKKFGESVPQLVNDYAKPGCMEDDLFSLLGVEDRPDYRWLIIGAPRSGSTFHIDPNGTSAWNACLTGAKKWIMFPPGQVPPGVFPSEDGSEVTSPVSLAEWFVHYYPKLAELERPPVEFVAKAGELVFVPSGWWHCVLNIEDEEG
eukprot:gene11017-1149_t